MLYLKSLSPPRQASLVRPFGMAWTAGVCLMLLLLCPAPTHAAAPVLVSSLELNAEGGAQIVLISLSRAPHTVHSFRLSDPARLVLDITPAQLPGTKRNLTTNHPLVHRMRASQFNTQTVRVVLDLKQDASHWVTTRPATVEHPVHQIVLSLRPDGPPESVPNGSGESAGQSGSQPEAVPAQSAIASSGDAVQPALEGAPVQTTADSQTGTDKKVFVFGGAKGQKEAQEETSPFETLDFSGFLRAKGAQELHEKDSEQARMFRNTIRLEGKWTPSGSMAGTDSVSETSNTFLLASMQADYLSFGPDPSSDDFDLELYEGYLFHATHDWDLRLGRQIVRWGKTDQISPVDNLNPQDMREFFIPDLEERKIPNWMARLRLFPGDVTVEGVFIPFFEENEFDYSGTTWALLGTEPSGLRIRESVPGKSLDNSDAGVRASTTVAGWDLALSYLYATEKSPHFRFDPANPMGPTLHSDYLRQHIYGFEFETTLDKFGFRGEGAYFDEQSFHTESLNSVAKPMAQFVIGADYIGEQDWYVNVQFSHEHIFDYESDILFLRQDNFYLNGEINREFWRGNAMLKLRYVLDLEDGGSFLTPEAILTYYKNLELSLGANVFFGPSESLFGRYRDNDQAFMKATYSF